MYKLYTVRDNIRVPPDMFAMVLDRALLQILREKYERKLDSDLGIILSIQNVREISGGYVVPGDGAAYYDVVYDVLTYLPEHNEVIETKVNDVVEFGAFLTLGPVEGLVHLSQVMDDAVKYDAKSRMLVGQNTKNTLRSDDQVFARIITVSLKQTILDTKVGLSMRSPGLGKAEWKDKKANAERKESGKSKAKKSNNKK